MKRAEMRADQPKVIKKIKKKFAKLLGDKKAHKKTVDNFFAKRGRWEDDRYLAIVENGLKLDGSPIAGRHRRFWQMIEFFKSVQHLDGHTAEAGCARGLSSYLICEYERLLYEAYDGASHHIFDSFLGLSMPGDKDTAAKGMQNTWIKQVLTRPPQKRINFMEYTKTTLQDFPNVNYYMGWIPEVFDHTTKREYKFVHLDLDLFDPIYHSLNYFYPQVVRGGCIVIDDYGFSMWPGVKLAADQWARENACNVIPLISGNAVVFKH